VPLHERAAYVIGRHATADIHVSDPEISAQHAAVVHTARHTFVADLNSRHGTFMDGVRVYPGAPARVKEGCELRIGNAPMRYVLRGVEPEPPFEESEDDGGEEARRKRLRWQDGTADAIGRATPVTDGAVAGLLLAGPSQQPVTRVKARAETPAAGLHAGSMASSGTGCTGRQAGSSIGLHLPAFGREQGGSSSGSPQHGGVLTPGDRSARADKGAIERDNAALDAAAEPRDAREAAASATASVGMWHARDPVNYRQGVRGGRMRGMAPRADADSDASDY